MKVFKPSPRYLTRLRVEIPIYAAVILVLGILTSGLVSLDARYTRQATLIQQVVVVFDLIWYLPALLLVRASYKAHTYFLSEEEVIIQSGWWTKSIHRVPLTSVVALEMHWDRLDPWLEIGALDLQTVNGRDGLGLRVRLAGLVDVEIVAQLALRQLQSLREESLVKWFYPDGIPDRPMLILRRGH